MNVKITQETVNRLLHRTEFDVEVESEAETPSRRQIIQAIAAKKGVKNDKLVVVDNVKQEYGGKTSKAQVKIYESEKALKLIEPNYKLERDAKSETKKKAKAAGAAPAEAAAPAPAAKPKE
jgi:ribosomal protein S24E